MRKTQPNFLVEYKGGRRQKSSPKESIWGAVDFSKLTSEIEHDLPPEVRSGVGGDGRSGLLEAVHTQSEEIASPETGHHVLEHGSDVEPRLDDHERGPMFVSGDNGEPALPAEPVSREQLAALEGENRELKRRLLGKLKEENHCLEKMLERFLP